MEITTSRSGDRLTLNVLDAISSEDDSDEDSHFGEENKEWNAEALALRQAIADGAFNDLIPKKGNTSEKKISEEVSIGADGITDNKKISDRDENSETENEEFETEDKKDGEWEKTESEDELEPAKYNFSGRKAILTVTKNLYNRRETMPWSENFYIVPSISLPLGGNCLDGSPLDIHDDLKREFAFYNMALHAVNDARACCTKARVSFSRPEDFFAEMIKSDDHMAKVKDRLIFETKKIDAVAQRKTNKEQKLRAKEKQSNKIAEKARKKKDHFNAIDEWTKSESLNRGSLTSGEDNQTKLNSRKRKGIDADENLQDKPNRKRLAANKRYGFGGRTGRFKQNDSKSMNDMSAYNPKGNFGGLGSKTRRGGNKRQGKRARDSLKAN